MNELALFNLINIKQRHIVRINFLKFFLNKKLFLKIIKYTNKKTHTIQVKCSC